MGTRMALKPVADWGRWTQTPTIQLWKAVALSCNIEPRTIAAEVMRVDAEVFGGFAVNLTDYRERRRIAEAHALPGGLLRVHKRQVDVAESEIVLADLRTFGEGCDPPWTFPEQFPRVVSQPKRPGTAVCVEDELAADSAPHFEQQASAPSPDRGRRVKRAVLIQEHSRQWSTIERDLKDAAQNGLSVAAKADGTGWWWEGSALVWAEARGKLGTRTAAPDAPLRHRIK